MNRSSKKVTGNQKTVYTTEDVGYPEKRGARRQPRSYVMLFVLTALAILPDDFTERELARNRYQLAARAAVREKEFRNYQQVVSEEMRRVGSTRSLPHLQELLDRAHVEMSRAQLAELHGPRFAAAIWRVRAAPAK